MLVLAVLLIGWSLIDIGRWLVQYLPKWAWALIVLLAIPARRGVCARPRHHTDRYARHGDCTRQAMLTREVERHYEKVQISGETRHAVGAHLHAKFNTLMASESDALSDLTKERARLEEQQGKLPQAHYAGAIPLNLLKKNRTASAAGWRRSRTG